MTFTHITADGAVIHTATGDGSLLWCRDDLRDGSNGISAQRGWAPNSSNQIGQGWNIQPEQQLEG
jgi:hypothetical protein